MRQSYLIRLVQLHALAVAEGTKKANKIETKIAPITILRVLLPTIDSTVKPNVYVIASLASLLPK